MRAHNLAVRLRRFGTGNVGSQQQLVALNYRIIDAIDGAKYTAIWLARLTLIFGVLTPCGFASKPKITVAEGQYHHAVAGGFVIGIAVS